MNYKQWLLYRAHSAAIEDTEPRVFGYVAWQNREYLRAWHSRARAIHRNTNLRETSTQ